MEILAVLLGADYVILDMGHVIFHFHAYVYLCATNRVPRKDFLSGVVPILLCSSGGARTL